MNNEQNPDEPKEDEFTPLVPPVTLDKSGKIHELNPKPAPVKAAPKPSPKRQSFISSASEVLRKISDSFFRKRPPEAVVKPSEEVPPVPVAETPPEPVVEPHEATPSELVTETTPDPVVEPHEATPSELVTETPPEPVVELNEATPPEPVVEPSAAQETNETETPPEAPDKPLYSNRIFVVHGTDERMKNKVIPVVEKLGLDPVRFDEGTSEQLTLYERTERNPDVGFAIVVLTIEDMAYTKNEKPAAAKARVSQDVVFQLGFLSAKLGRQRVFVLYPRKDNFELPTRFFDAYYTPFDDEGRWKRYLIDRLKSCDYEIPERPVV